VKILLVIRSLSAVQISRCKQFSTLFEMVNLRLTATGRCAALNKPMSENARGASLDARSKRLDEGDAVTAADAIRVSGR